MRASTEHGGDGDSGRKRGRGYKGPTDEESSGEEKSQSSSWIYCGGRIKRSGPGRDSPT
ncbi:hypothetical protein YC2023_052002 [Brassica napus]